MPTFKVLIGPEKQDNTFPVMIQLYHAGSKKYLPTGHLVSKKQVSIKKGVAKLKDEYVINQMNADIVAYKERLLKYNGINHATVQQIKEFLITKEDSPIEIDFIAYGRTFIETQTKSTGKNTETVLNAFVDFLGIGNISIHEVNLKMLQAFAVYLQSERKVKRNNGSAGLTEYTLKSVSTTAIKDYIGKLRQIFIAARDEYNDEDNGKILIVHYPFRKFKMPKIKVAKKRNLKADQIKLIRDAKDIDRRTNLARDVFMLSFYLVGINSVDLFNLTGYKHGRVSFYRSKTESRKEELSFISIKVEPEALPLFEKYRDEAGKCIFNFHRQYRNADAFNKAVNLGLKKLAVDINIDPINLGYARGSWSTIARNDCKISKEDIHFALNHSDPAMKVTDLYIQEDFSIVDKANRKVLNLLKK
jgi:hypothetical protein